MKAGIRTIAAVGTAASLVAGAHAAEIIPIYADAPGEGYFSNQPPDAASAAAGNPGDTLGEQRRWAFEQAASFWEVRLKSTVPIQVKAQMDPLSCSLYSGILGAAGPTTANGVTGSGGSPHPIPLTWYVISLFERLTDQDANGSSPDITSQFNSQLYKSSCLGTTEWFYGLGDAPRGTLSFIDTVIHEIGHGLGVLTLVTLQNGDLCCQPPNEYPDVYMLFLEDHSLGKTWDQLLPWQRAASATDTNDLHWIGPDVLAHAVGNLADGVSNGHVEMYAPSTLQRGSSVSHVDDDVRDATNTFDTMTPFAHPNSKLLVTDDLLHDIGWNDVPATLPGCPALGGFATVTGTLTGNAIHKACDTVIYEGAVVQSGLTQALAGQTVILKDGFTVKQGAIFTVNTGVAF